MAWEDKFHVIPTLEASGDLSSNQGFFVVLSSGQVAVAGDGARAIGVLRNKPAAAGRTAEVQDLGVARVECGGTVAQDANVASDASGNAVTAASGDHILGVALEAGSDGEVISVLLQYGGTA